MRTNQKNCKTAGEVLELFEDLLSAPEMLTARLMAQISSSLARERIKRNMSQKAFAEYLGVTQSEISRWESGGYNFSIKKLAELACLLDLDVSISISGSASPESAQFPQSRIIQYSGGSYSRSASFTDKKEACHHASIR